MTTIYDLPQPENAFLMRSKTLTASIRQEMEKQNGSLSFANFMELALYHPELGYYNTETFQIGKQGDFTTAPEISPLFTKCFANQIKQIASRLSPYQLMEAGAGNGTFAKDLLIELDKFNCLPDHYFIYEISPGLRLRQQELLKTHCPDFFLKIIWLDALPDKFNGIIIANEVLDALPFHCFYIEDKNVKEKKVCWEKNAFAWKLETSVSDLFLQQTEILRNRYSLPSGYMSEINFSAASFIQSLAQTLNEGLILFVDYGYGQREYYHPQRNQGTIACFYKHIKHENPLIFPGLQDITAHVDFTSVIETAAEAGCSLSGFTSQSAFLLGCGLTELAEREEENLSELEKFELHHAIKILTLPTEMGERIKVMALGKNFHLNNLLGFALQDRRREL